MPSPDMSRHLSEVVSKSHKCFNQVIVGASFQGLLFLGLFGLQVLVLKAVVV